MSEWKRYKLSELYEMSSGISSTKEQAGHGSPFLSFSVVFNNYFLPDSLIDLMDTTDGEKQKYSINEGDIFLTRTSETVDELAMSSVALKDYPEASFSGFLKRLRPVDKTIVYPKFMSFYLRSPLFRRTIINNTVMTLRASFNEAMFSYLEIMLPDFETQKKIGDFLYSLEKKKQINNQVNQELEAMAKTLYDYWFVQFDFPDQNGKPYKSSGGKMVYNPELKREIPERWGVEELGDVAYLKAGGDKPSNISEIQSKETPFPIYSNGLDNKGLYGYTNKATIHKKSLTVSARGTIGYVQRRFSSFFPIIRLISVTPKEEKMIGYIENFLKSIQFENSGSVQRQLTVPQIDKLYILVPKNEVLKKYHSMTVNYYSEVENNEQQNQELTQLRDWLLPMLMNGQVKVE